MTGVSNLGHRKKGHINKRNRKARKRRKEVDTFKLWAYSAEVIVGQPQKSVVFSVPCFQLKNVDPKRRKISGVGDVDQLCGNKVASTWEGNFSF